ncbi:MAG: AMP-dependent synthetase/ligase [Anaerovoracaceae bacterium]
MRKLEDLRQVIDMTAEMYPRNSAFVLKEKDGSLEDIDYTEYSLQVKSLAEALIRRGFGGGRIAMFGKNSYGWFLANVAAQYGGCVSVPLDRELKYDEYLSSLIRAEVEVVFYDRKQKALTEKAVASGKTSVKQTFALYESDDPDIFDLLEEGRKYEAEGFPEVSSVTIDPDAVSFLIFTSGTTSQSKIVMLSQGNIAADIMGLFSAVPLRDTDTNIAILPYHHTYGSTGQWYMIANGARTVYCDGLKYIQKNLKEYGVSTFVGVPLLVEAMYKRIMKTAEKAHVAGYIKAMRKVAGGLKKVRIDVRRRMFRGIIEALGGEMRICALGASAADPEVIKAFDDFGIECLQGYGLTETSPVVSCERPDAMRPGSVGLPVSGVQVDIFEPDDNGVGEIMVKGPTVMKGYYGNKEATDEVLRNGWFYTGDLGRIDDDGYLYITGRKKNVIVLRNGKNVFPEELEEEIGHLPYVLENIVVGIDNEVEGKEIVVTAKIVYDDSYFSGKSKKEIAGMIQDDVEKINKTTPPYKRIKRVIVTDEPMVKTSTGKVRRFIEIENIKESEEKRIAAGK